MTHQETTWESDLAQPGFNRSFKKKLVEEFIKAETTLQVLSSKVLSRVFKLGYMAALIALLINSLLAMHPPVGKL